MPKYVKGASGNTYEVGASGSLGKDMARNLFGYTPSKPAPTTVKTQTSNTAAKGSSLFKRKVK